MVIHPPSHLVKVVCFNKKVVHIMGVDEANSFFDQGDYASAYKIYDEIVKTKNNSECMGMVGYMNFYGLGCEQSTSRAIEYFNQSYLSGHIQYGLYMYKALLAQGEKNRAIALLEELCIKHQHIPSIFRMGINYNNGFLVVKSKLKAYDFFCMADKGAHLLAKKEKAKLLISGVKGRILIPYGFLTYLIFVPMVIIEFLKDPGSEILKY